MITQQAPTGCHFNLHSSHHDAASRKRKRQLWKQRKRRAKRRQRLFEEITNPCAFFLLYFEPYFSPRDAFDLLYGPLHRVRQVVQRLNDFEGMLLGQETEEQKEFPTVAVCRPARTRWKTGRLEFWRRSASRLRTLVEDPASIPRRLYDQKVAVGRIRRAPGYWGAFSHSHLAAIQPGIVPRNHQRSEYLIRLEYDGLEVFSASYVPLVVLPMCS